MGIPSNNISEYFLNQNPNFLHLICMTRKIKHIIGMIWWQFRKKKLKRRLFERIKASNPSKYSF